MDREDIRAVSGLCALTKHRCEPRPARQPSYLQHAGIKVGWAEAEGPQGPRDAEPRADSRDLVFNLVCLQFTVCKLAGLNFPRKQRNLSLSLR